MDRMLPFACRLAGSALLFPEAVPLRQTVPPLFFFARSSDNCQLVRLCMTCFVQAITLLRIFRLDISSALLTAVRTVAINSRLHLSKDCSSMNLSVRSCSANQEKTLQNYLRTHWRSFSLKLKQILGPFDGRPCKVFPHALGERHPSQPVRNMCWRTFPHVPSYRNSKR